MAQFLAMRVAVHEIALCRPEDGIIQKDLLCIENTERVSRVSTERDAGREKKIGTGKRYA